MTRDETIEVLLEVAKKTIEREENSGIDHPEDIALAMEAAIETAGLTLTVLRKRGKK